MNMLPEERDRLTRVETKLDGHFETLKKYFEKQEEDRGLVETRLKTLETFQKRLVERIAYITGAFTAVATLAGYFIKEILNYIHYILWGN